METETVNTTHWRSNILIVLVVLAAILLALILAQMDNLNELIQPLPTAVAGLSGSGGDNGNAEAGVPTPLPTLTAIPTNAHTPTPEATTATPTSVPTLPTCGSIPPGWIPYKVRPGDTLFALSIRSGASMGAIIQANCLEMDKLIAGTTIYLPPTPPVLPPCGVPAYWVAYTVQSGDTLYSLATRTGTTVYKIMRANCLTSSHIYTGQKLYLPSHPVATATATPPTVMPTATSTVTVTGTPPTATATGTLLPTVTATVTTTAFPTTTVFPTTTAVPTIITTAFPTTTVFPTLPPPTSTTLPTAYPPGPSPTVLPPPTAYP